MITRFWATLGLAFNLVTLRAEQGFAVTLVPHVLPVSFLKKLLPETTAFWNCDALFYPRNSLVRMIRNLLTLRV